MPIIEAILEGYLFKNETTGYSVASLFVGLKAVGKLPDIKVGEKLKTKSIIV